MKIEPPAANPAIIQAIAAKATEDGFIELPDFIQTALYHPTEGYYRQARQRVGKTAASDFYTSTSLKEAFADIVLEAAIGLLEQSGLSPSQTTWVELGAEPEGTLLDPANSPFQDIQTIGAADALQIPTQAVVFSNELFDAQPFRQVRFDGERWLEYGVRFEDTRLHWSPRSKLSDEAASFCSKLPTQLPNGYTIDLPTGAANLAKSILNASWRGAFIAFDYGKTWQGITEDTPQGSARGYYKHQLLPDILAAPGQIDITHHICWDHLEAELASAAFQNIDLQSQEAFIVHRAPKFLQKAFDPALPAFSPIKQKLKELMHPAMMGQKFQALSAVRTELSQR